jgi:hypothetical protein
VSERPETHNPREADGYPERSEPHDPPEPLGPGEPRPARPDPLQRPPDPAGTRPKVHPDELRPSEGFRALPAGEPAGERLPEPLAPAPAAPAVPGRAPAVPPQSAVTPAQSAALPSRLRPARLPAPHAPRFQFLLGALGAAGAAIALSLALAPTPKAGPPWSLWKPSGDVDPAVQIAEHVAPQYALSHGHPLVSVSGGPQAIGGQPVVVALRSSGSSPAALPENGVLYQLCGEGPNCSIPGKATNARGLLVRREALELALYTFRYVSGASQVLVTYPPRPPAKGAKGSSEEALSAASTQARGRALLFRPGDLAPELSRPLDATLAGTAPTLATVERAPEAALVNMLTGRLVYNFELTTQQSTPVLLLQAPSIGS